MVLYFILYLVMFMFFYVFFGYLMILLLVEMFLVFLYLLFTLGLDFFFMGSVIMFFAFYLVMDALLGLCLLLINYRYGGTNFFLW